MQLTVFFDFLCPYAWRASRWLDQVIVQRPTVSITWRYFSLEQVNAPADANWYVWDQPDDYTGLREGWSSYRGLHAFWAAEAVRRQGEAEFNRFRTALYDARHERNVDVASRDSVAEIAATCDVDMALFSHDVHDRSLLEVLKRDHEYAKTTYDCFGVPTLCFDDKNAVYVKLSEIVTAENVLPLFDDVAHMFVNRPYVAELKRPNP
jgi:predicted DsbA family dithiol-disulfide isomerase